MRIGPSVIELHCAKVGARVLRHPVCANLFLFRIFCSRASSERITENHVAKFCAVLLDIFSHVSSVSVVLVSMLFWTGSFLFQMTYCALQ